MGTGPTVNLSSSSSFTLNLIATDSQSFSHQKQIWVQVDSEAPECLR